MIDKSDEWIYQQIEVAQKKMDGLKSLLTDRAKDRQKDILLNQELQFKYEEFCNYLQHPINYNTKRVNKEYGTCLRNYDHFEEIKNKYQNDGFDIDEFKQLTGGKT